MQFRQLMFGFAMGVVTYELAGGVALLKNPFYGLYGFPSCLVLSAILGYTSPRRCWLWGMLIVPPNLLWTHIRSSRPSPLFLVELVFLSALTLMAFMAGFFGSSLHDRRH